MPRPFLRPARGASLVELLVGMVITLMVLGIALQLTLIARERHLRLADEALIEDRGMQALELIGRAVRQAGWITDTPASSSVRRWPDAGAPPSLVGKDNCGSPTMLPTLDCGGSGERGSDALLIRFAGRSTEAADQDGDGATRDCAGYPVPERIKGESDPRPGRILLYISRSSDSEQAPQLMCRSLKREYKNPPEDPRAGYGMVRGVETLQLLYTLAPTATAPAATVSARGMTEKDWYRVRLVHVSMVVRGDRLSAKPTASNTIALFPELSAVQDAKTQEDMTFQPTDPHRNRTRFSATLAVRNPLHCEADAC